LKPIRWATSLVDAWFTAPEPNAAGRMGLFRIVYALFYLWHVSLFDLRAMGGMPRHHWQVPMLLSGFPDDPALLQGIDLALAGVLVLLAFGLHVRLMTFLVLVIGVLREAYPSVLDVEDGNVFLIFYIPLFMLIAGRWGETYSIDALRRRERDGTTIDPSDGAWTHFLPARAALVILTVLFVSSPLFKAAFGGTWIEYRDMFSMLMLERNIDAARQGFLTNPVASWLAGHRTLGYCLQLSVLAFEGVFFLALFDRRLRALFFAIALVFHSVNALWLLVSFTPILIVYLMFIDWQALWSRVAPRALPSPSARACTIVALEVAAAIALTWHLGARAVFSVGGLTDWQTPWFSIFPVAAILVVVHLVRFVPRSQRTSMPTA
jgi:hypothetical protein